MQLTAKHCLHCDQILSTDKYHCPVCYSENLETQELGGEGTVYSYTKIYAAPAPLDKEAPYHVLLVDLKEGLRVTARYLDEQVEIGQKVFYHYTDSRAYFFSRKVSM